jgi:hypothetical protein
MAKAGDKIRKRLVFSDPRLVEVGNIPARIAFMDSVPTLDAPQRYSSTTLVWNQATPQMITYEIDSATGSIQTVTLLRYHARPSVR